MKDSTITRYLDRYLEKSNVLAVTDPETAGRLKRYVTFLDTDEKIGNLYRLNGMTILDDSEVALEDTAFLYPAGRLLDALEYIPDVFDED